MLARTLAGKTQDPVAKLKGQIRRKTSEKLRLQQDMAACQRDLEPLAAQQQQLLELDAEIHTLFQRILADPKLAKHARKQVREVYEQLQDDQAISLAPERQSELNSCDCPFCGGSAGDAETWPREPVYGSDTETQSWEPEPIPPSAARPERDAGVRALYRKLALRFHPDRAGDEGRRAEHEAVMREVNEAYHGGDTDRLLELSRELGVEVGELRATDGLLAELVGQYERLKAEVRALRNSPLGMLVADVRRAQRDRDRRSPIDAIREETEGALQQSAEIRDLVRDLAEGKISLKVFMRGPQVGSPFDAPDADEADVLEELLGMFDDLASALSPRSGTARRKAKGPSGKVRGAAGR